MSSAELSDLILIGRIIRPHGLTGLLRIISYAQSRETFLEAGSIFLHKSKNELDERKVVSITSYGEAYLLRLSGVDSIDHAKTLKGLEILIRKDSLNKNQDEFFWYELLGLDVYLTTGEYLGILREIFSTGSNDVYVVENQGREVLIPAIHQVVKEIDVPRKKMFILLLKGLLDFS